MREKTFNTAGPCVAEWHYMLPPERRLPGVDLLIERAQYFVVHAPRQSGKTTSFRAVAERLVREGRYAALWASCEAAQAAGDDAQRGVPAVVSQIAQSARLVPEELRPPSVDSIDSADPLSLLQRYLAAWAERCPRPIVLFLDEIDALRGTTLISVLRQLRSAYPERPRHFPQSVALIGLRDVRDYRLEAEPAGATLGTSSPFNIKVESLSLRDFTPDEIRELYRQHEEATGQTWGEDALARVAELTRGQPWLVNALARQIVEVEVTDCAIAIDASAVERAKERLILRRDTHLDSLAVRLRDPRIRRVIEPLIAGDFLGPEVTPDDLDFVVDLGLVRWVDGFLEIANPIYREVIPRSLAITLEPSIPAVRPNYIDESGRLRLERLLEDFASFWREHSESFLLKAPYSEAAAQLVFMAYLHKVVNGGGFIDREYAVVAGRIDLCIRWPHAAGIDRFAFELKVRRQGRDVQARGLDQLAAYLERLGLEEGTLVIFDADGRAGDWTSDESTSAFVEHRGRRIRVLEL